MSFISGFINSAVKAGIIPKSTKDIIETQTFRRIAQNTDKAGKRSISYWLRIEHDFAYGYIKDHKTGLETNYRSYSDDPSITRMDIIRIKKLLKERQVQQERVEAERHAKIAQRAKIRAAQCINTGSTHYLDKKNIPLLSALISPLNPSNLFIPIYDNEEIVSWQTIYPCGKKRFPFGGKKKGCWHTIGGPIDPLQPIIICEGWATGASIHLATSSPVVIAFDAGNLIHVARSIRKLYPATQIIIAGDNDKSQTGQKAALDVQTKVSNVSVNICPVPEADFNDLDLEQVKTCFGIQESGDADPSGSGLQPSSSGVSADWMSNLITDNKGRLVASSTQNAILYMLYHHDFSGVFAYDEFRQGVILKRCPPWEYEEKFKISELTDIHITQASATLERYGITCGIEKTSKAIDVVADCNKFHSARQYFSALEWDGIPRLETFCLNYLGTKQESPEYLAFVFKKWMTAGVKRIMEPGCKFDHVLILESQKQGLYKSQFLKEIATFSGECYHTDSINIGDLENKDTVMKMQGNLIIELAELSGFSRKDDNQIKNWMTQTNDQVRIPFARKVVNFLRQFIFSATTNNYDYLRDPTGNRRYWPVTVEKEIDINAVREIKGQLWAEAYHHYKNILYIGPTIEENALADIERGKRMQSDAWEDMVVGIIRSLGLDEFKTSDILGKMDLKTNDKNERSARRIGTILKGLGYENSPQWDKNLGKSVRVWCKP